MYGRFFSVCPHKDLTYHFGPHSVRIDEETYLGLPSVCIKDQTSNLGENVRKKVKISCQKKRFKPNELMRTATHG